MIHHIVNDIETYTYKRYNYDKLHLLYETYFNALKFSGYLCNEDLEDIKYLCLHSKR